MRGFVEHKNNILVRKRLIPEVFGWIVAVDSPPAWLNANAGFVKKATISCFSIKKKQQKTDFKQLFYFFVMFYVSWRFFYEKLIDWSTCHDIQPELFSHSFNHNYNHCIFNVTLIMSVFSLLEYILCHLLPLFQLPFTL